MVTYLGGSILITIFALGGSIVSYNLQLFAKLYEQTSIIITTHLKFEEWGEIFGNAKATKAIIDRLTHHCHIIETGNKSFRGEKDITTILQKEKNM